MRQYELLALVSQANRASALREKERELERKKRELEARIRILEARLREEGGEEDGAQGS